MGYLATQYAPSPMLVYDYAMGGDRVDGVRRQIEKDFLPHLAQKPRWAPWTGADTLFGMSTFRGLGIGNARTS